MRRNDFLPKTRGCPYDELLNEKGFFREADVAFFRPSERINQELRIILIFSCVLANEFLRISASE